MLLRPLAAADEPEVRAAQAELARDDFNFLLDEREGESWPAYARRVTSWRDGEGLAPGFVPSTLHELVEYRPTLVEWQVTAGVWAVGLLVFTVAVKVAIPALETPHDAGSRAPAPTRGES